MFVQEDTMCILSMGHQLLPSQCIVLCVCVCIVVLSACHTHVRCAYTIWFDKNCSYKLPRLLIINRIYSIKNSFTFIFVSIFSHVFIFKCCNQLAAAMNRSGQRQLCEQKMMRHDENIRECDMTIYVQEFIVFACLFVFFSIGPSRSICF